MHKNYYSLNISAFFKSGNITQKGQAINFYEVEVAKASVDDPLFNNLTTDITSALAYNPYAILETTDVYPLIEDRAAQIALNAFDDLQGSALKKKQSYRKLTDEPYIEDGDSHQIRFVNSVNIQYST